VEGGRDGGHAFLGAAHRLQVAQAEGRDALPLLRHEVADSLLVDRHLCFALLLALIREKKGEGFS
jgi:hypothetical protein